MKRFLFSAEIEINQLTGCVKKGVSSWLLLICSDGLVVTVVELCFGGSIASANQIVLFYSVYCVLRKVKKRESSFICYP